MARANYGSGTLRPDGYRLVYTDGVRSREHIAVAERALGKPLPAVAIVHHVNEDRADNRPANLVICPDIAYHSLIHMRMKARAAGVALHFRKCQLCQSWDEPSNLRFTKDGGCSHKACRADYEYSRKRRINPLLTTQRQKVTEDQALEIRAARSGGESLGCIAARYGVHPSHVSRICSGKVFGSGRKIVRRNGAMA